MSRDEVFALLLAQEVAEAVLAFAIAVERSRIVVADAGIPGGAQCLLCLVFADGVEEFAQWGAAEAESAELAAGAKRAGGDGRHGICLSLAGCFTGAFFVIP